MEKIDRAQMVYSEQKKNNIYTNFMLNVVIVERVDCFDKFLQKWRNTFDCTANILKEKKSDFNRKLLEFLI